MRSSTRRKDMVRGYAAALTAVMLLSACSSGTAGSAQTALLVGTVYAAPTCPVERISSPCPPRPVVGATVVAYRGSQPAGTTRTGAGGRFQLRLSVGSYTIRATNIGGYASTATKDVYLTATGASVDLTVDSGIR